MFSNLSKKIFFLAAFLPLTYCLAQTSNGSTTSSNSQTIPFTFVNKLDRTIYFRANVNRDVAPSLGQVRPNSSYTFSLHKITSTIHPNGYEPVYIQGVDDGNSAYFSISIDRSKLEVHGQLAAKMNRCPRKCLGYKTPQELFIQQYKNDCRIWS
ncbi:hypothetical protein [Coxiella burnetii]|uniref:hypothetical protein n=2 Tax=Coxiella burnetii TaxID=777 RepID=UPI000AB04936|nr:hypothetical protein [Coxiella burnetii]